MWRVWIGFFVLVVFSCSVVAQIDSSVDDAFLSREEVSVIVILKEENAVGDGFGKLQKASAKQRKAVLKEVLKTKRKSVKAQQDKVLSSIDAVDSKETIDPDQVDFKLNHKFKTINGFTGKVTRKGLEKLRNDPNVQRIHLDRQVSISLDASIPVVKADQVWNLSYNGTMINGTGETVCVIDTGVNKSHMDLPGKVIAEYCFCDNETADSDGIGCCPNGNPTDTNSTDDEGHGTHVIGIIASNNLTYKGVAPGANIVSVKALNASGSGLFSHVALSVDWCVDNAATFNISVISMSIGDKSQINTSPTCDGFATSIAIDSAVAAGIIVTVASGNEGYSNGINFPGCASNATSIGSTTDADAISGFTNTAEILDLMAPGSSIISLSYTGGTTSKSGTSMATPHAAGAAALLQQFHKLHFGYAMSPNNIKTALRDNGFNVTDSGNNLSFPRIDIRATITALDNLTPTITFVNPTFANGSFTNETSVTINITGSETLTSALLEFNNSNITMNGSDLNWFYSIHNLTGWQNFTVHANDSSNNFGFASIEIYFNNSAPIITSFFPNATNFTIIEPNNQTFNITYNDTENNTQNQPVTFYWYDNGNLAANTQNYTFLGNFSVEGYHNITIIISDGNLNTSNTWNFTVNNSNRVPSASNISITPANPTTSDNITCTYTFSDQDNETETATLIEWFVDGAVNTTFENYTTINSTNISKNQVWSCSVTPSDGIGFGANINSSNITIQNSPPILSTIANITILETQLINITANATDADLDSLNYSINDSRFSQDNNSFTWQTKAMLMVREMS